MIDLFWPVNAPYDCPLFPFLPWRLVSVVIITRVFDLIFDGYNFLLRLWKAKDPFMMM